MKEWIDKVFRAAEQHDAAILATPVTNTLKRVDANQTIEQTVSRSNLWAAQTPQVFRRQWLLDAYAARGNLQPTDEAQLIENLGSTRAPAWSTPAYSYGAGRRGNRDSNTGEFSDRHYNYEDESQETPRISNSQKGKGPDGGSIDNIARFFGGKGGAKPGGFPRPQMHVETPKGHSQLRKGQRVRHSKYGEGTVLIREGEGEDAKLTVMFPRHGLKKLMEKFANLEKL